MRQATSFGLGVIALGVLLGLGPSCGGDDADGSAGPSGTGASSSGGSGGSGGSDASSGGVGGLNLDSGTGGQAGSNDACAGDACGSDAGPACGDGKIDPGEKCDDANGASGDGCAANCDAIEKDWACPTPGQPCISTVKCGDSKISGAETCDDGNANPADGCNASCMLESGWKCPNLGAKCAPAQCGDGIVVGGEQCDDAGAATPGCDASCKLEPGYKCPTPGQPCSATTCGDAKPEGTEQCDDGNHDMGDGCTPFCVKEPNCAAGECSSAIAGKSPPLPAKTRFTQSMTAGWVRKLVSSGTTFSPAGPPMIARTRL